MKKHLPLLILGALLLGIVALNTHPYGSITAIFHMDEVVERDNGLPAGFVVLGIPSYDGAQYYQVARNVPKIVNPSRWPQLTTAAPGSYAYQRFLLPLSAFVVSLGHDALLPYAFLLANLTALLLTAFVLLRRKVSPIFILALCLSPAATVGLHFTLAEPLTILVITAVLLRYAERGRFDWQSIVLLSLLVLAREVNILFIAYLFSFSILQRRWRDIPFLLIPTAVFVGWHAVIFGIFGNIPFLISAEAKEFPGWAAMKLILGHRGYDVKTLSAIALFLGVVLPGTVWSAVAVWKTKATDILTLGSLAFFGVMLVMPDYIWGSITSIGRVITPVYPLYLLSLAQRNSRLERVLAAAVLSVGLAAAVGLGLIVHPYTVAL